eukprot:1623800-Alexandrium_andersonii.AAC.1
MFGSLDHSLIESLIERAHANAPVQAEKRAPGGIHDALYFYNALTPNEQARLKGYLGKNPTFVCDLGQNPVDGLGAGFRSKLSEPLFTSVKGAGLIWVPGDIKRWMAPSELGVAMGFPVLPEHVSATGTDCLFSKCAGARSEWRT